MTVSSTANSTTLAPSYKIPLFLIVGGLLGAAVAFFQFGKLLLGLAGLVLLFGLFLLYQANTLRLVFSDSVLDVYRGSDRIRQFPYDEWETWDIFWTSIPILFYFREVNSIHFLPILFDPAALRSQLRLHVPSKPEDAV
ncbi:MAG: DUF3119 family protein [Leptolyngbyaceae cyanobacterium]